VFSAVIGATPFEPLKLTVLDHEFWSHIFNKPGEATDSSASDNVGKTAGYDEVPSDKLT
jgi:hypothetical protein